MFTAFIIITCWVYPFSICVKNAWWHYHIIYDFEKVCFSLILSNILALLFSAHGTLHPFRFLRKHRTGNGGCRKRKPKTGNACILGTLGRVVASIPIILHKDSKRTEWFLEHNGIIIFIPPNPWFFFFLVNEKEQLISVSISVSVLCVYINLFTYLFGQHLLSIYCQEWFLPLKGSHSMGEKDHAEKL